eukprot:PLAT1738.1.p1 GENE.PLAT1738.1~~PLAT1738.1.p1  ORF type:complete len:238 (+),score=82.96 PLAT1738.1:72-716(+)
MVYYFTVLDHVVYVGRDKYENEELIKYGWPEDVWFHVADMSSAHVYLRLKEGESIETLSEELIMYCAQLVKAKSIKGNKLRSVTVDYTLWSNLCKREDMDVGTIGFHDYSKVRQFVVPRRNRDMLRELKATMEEREPDLAEEKRERDEAELRAFRKKRAAKRALEKAERAERRRIAEERDYARIHDVEDSKEYNDDVEASADASAAIAYEESFM